MTRTAIITVVALAISYVLAVAGCAASQRKLLYFPTHNAPSGTTLAPWMKAGETVGFYLENPSPKTVWLMTHGNAGQAADRTYALHCFPEGDSVYILEYPGFGLRSGSPSKGSMNRAAEELYLDLRSRFPGLRIGVVGESIGSGPASYLCSLPNPPDKLILVVPFEKLSAVAAERLPFIPVSLILRDNWDNAQALNLYAGPIEIFGALDDQVIHITHARSLADHLPKAKFHLIRGGHNDWAQGGKVTFRIDD